MNQILALHQPLYDRVIMLENDTYIFGTPIMPDGHFVVRESYIDMGRIQCRNTTTLISALVDLADDLVEFVVKQGDASLRDPRVQMLIEHERQPRVSDEEITRIWLDDKREHVTVIPSTRRTFHPFTGKPRRLHTLISLYILVNQKNSGSGVSR